MTVEQIQEYLRERLSEKRMRHSLAVADMAKELAERNGADPEKAYLAGLVHDIMREAAPAQAERFMSEHGIVLTELERHAPNLWHAVLGAVAIQTELGITDPEIVLAVRYHTTGRAGMSLLERIVYVADCTSADRRYPDVEDMRRRARTNLNDAVRGSLDYCVSSLRAQGVPVHPDTLAALEEFLR